MGKAKLALSSAIHGGSIVKRIECESADRRRAIASDLDGEDVGSLQELLRAVRARDDLRDDEYDHIFGEYDAVDKGLDAAELLAHRNSVGSVPPILSFFCWLVTEGEEETLAASGPSIISCFGPEAAPPMADFVVESRGNTAAKRAILEGLQQLGDKNPAVQREMLPFIVRGLKDPHKLAPELNSQLMMWAIEWQLADASEVIERAFSMNRIDCGMAGDWQDVRKLLHVEGLGLPMPAKPLNSIVDFRRNVGVGAFSREPLHLMGEIQEQAVEKYLETACRAFAQSKEGKALFPDGGFPSSIWQFLELAMNYLGVNVENMSVANAKELLLEIFPRKVSMDADESDNVIDELVAFWSFCDRIHGIEQAASLAKSIGKLRAAFRHRMGDPANFGMAKGFFMAGQQAGFDMTTQEGLNEFMLAYNHSIAGGKSHQVGATPVENRVDTPHEQSQPAAMSLKKRKKVLVQLKKRKRQRSGRNA